MKLYIRIHLDSSGYFWCQISIYIYTSCCIKDRWRDSLEETPNLNSKKKLSCKSLLAEPPRFVGARSCFSTVSPDWTYPTGLSILQTIYAIRSCKCTCYLSDRNVVQSISFYKRCMLVVVDERKSIRASPWVLVRCKLHRHCNSNAHFQPAIIHQFIP